MTKGFSLIEMLTTIAIVSIMASLGVPSFNKFVEEQRITTDINSVIRMANLARSEAIKTKQPISLCGFNQAQECTTNWAKLRTIQHDKAETKYSFQFSGNYKSVNWSSFQRKPSLTFNSMGFSTHLNGSLYLCHAQYSNLHRAIRISKSGKATVIKDPSSLNQRCN